MISAVFEPKGDSDLVFSITLLRRFAPAPKVWRGFKLATPKSPESGPLEPRGDVFPDEE
jgi:hypothetical protein